MPERDAFELSDNEEVRCFAGCLSEDYEPTSSNVALVSSCDDVLMSGFGVGSGCS